jgi:hypothetical protein
MEIDIATKRDLIELKQQMITELIALMENRNPKKAPREWLKTYEVRELLDISKSTLHQLRINGSLSFTRIGHCIYYNYGDILQLMEKNKTRLPKGPGRGTNRFSQPR